ncbi:hypothetical protein NFI96_004716 [Prochilodus magdalenae]|nr:hypothetical protein NFI96_004716 [Prochilodus magdalenae]
MEVNSVNSSLTITAVQDSDSGLYYCSRLENKYMVYSTTTYLHIREKFPASSNEPDGDDRWSDGFFILALVGGAVIVVLLSVLLVLLFTMLKYRRQHREVLPEVSLFQKDSSSPVVCHATGFFPKAVMISWQKNGEDLFEDVDLRETLPNQDGTFQRRSILTVPPEEL